MLSVPATEDILAGRDKEGSDISLSTSVTRSHADLELLVSDWNVENHFVGEFTPTLGDVSVMFHLSLFAEEGMLQLLNFVLRVSNKSTYTSWIRYFRRGEERRKWVTVEALLSYWLSQCILRSGVEDGINTYVFPLAIRLEKGKKLPLGPVYLEPLYARLDKCAKNITRAMGRYDMVTYAHTSFRQIFL